MARVDLNCDLGEGAGHDAELFAYATSANIACGGHTGDEASMAAAVELALRHRVAIGAHPSLADRENFGRVEHPVWPEEVYQLVLTQTLALQRIAHAAGARLAQVKPHGALYNLAARNTLIAEAVARGVYEVDPRLRLFGLSGSHSIAAARACGLEAAQEAFADRTYEPDGTLTPRSRPGAVLADADAVVAQALALVREGRVRTRDGTEVTVAVDTLCLHGDGPDPVGFARKLREALAAAGIDVGNYSPGP